MHRGVRHRARAAAVGAHHRHVAVAVDALPAGPHGGREAVQPFVLVVRLAAVDRREAPVAAREDRGKNIVVGERIVAGAQLQHVVLPREGQLAREPATEDQLDRAAALHPLVARAVGHVAPQADAAADLRGSAPAQLHAEPLETVEARRLEVGADADVFRVPVARQEGVDDRVDVAVERHLLHAVDHGVDAPLAVGEAVGAHLLPVGVVVPLRLGLVHHYLVVGAEHLRGQRLADAHVGIDHLARADERDHARRVARGDRELGRRAVAVPEPETVAHGAVLALEHQVLDPVDVHAARHARRGRAQGVARRVDADLAVEHGRGRALGVEADEVGLAPLVLEAVDQEVVVVGEPRVGERAGEAHVEDVDEVGVEVDVAVHVARELGHREGVVDARDAAGADHLAPHIGSAAAVALGRRLGDHRRQVGLAGHGRGVHVVEHEAEVALQALAAEAGLDVGQVQLHLGVGRAAVAVVALGIVAILAADDLAQDGVGGVLARRDHHRGDVELRGLQGEVDLREAPHGHARRLRLVADHLGQDEARRVARLEGVEALLVGGDAHGGAREEHAGEGYGLTRSGVGDAAAHARGLRGSGGDGGQADEKQDGPAK